jgi:hypothetical protein
MNYIWDMAIKSAQQGIDRKTITFLPAASYSPYMELALPDINTVTLYKPLAVEINPYYRFCDIFRELLNINLPGHEELRSVFFDIITHYLLFLDCQQGLNKREYYYKFIGRDIKAGVFGETLKDYITAFSIDDFRIVLSGLISLYWTSASIRLFKEVVRKIFSDAIIYYRSEDTPEVLIYLATAETETTRPKIKALLMLFLPLGFTFRLYWEKHFGIIDMEKTMRVDYIVIY